MDASLEYHRGAFLWALYAVAAFLVDSEGAIINHPYDAYQMSTASAVNVQDTEYANAYYNGRITIFRDYHGGYDVCLTRRSDVSGFTVVVNRWRSIYKSVVIMALVFAALFILCSSVMVALIDRLIRSLCGICSP